MSMCSSCLLNMQIKKQFTHGFEIVSKRVSFSTRFSFSPWARPLSSYHLEGQIVSGIILKLGRRCFNI